LSHGFTSDKATEPHSDAQTQHMLREAMAVTRQFIILGVISSGERKKTGGKLVKDCYFYTKINILMQLGGEK